MSGIPVYTQSPIKAAKADAITPQTAAPTTSTHTAPAHAPATTTTDAAASSPYTPAQPGQHGGPIPTTSTNHPPTGPAHNYVPSPPTPTKTSPYDAPPPPQPGAVPTLRSALPPPPKTGERYMPAAPAQAHMPVGYPPQTLAGSFPRRLSAQGLGGGVGAGGEGRRSFEHPPGYHQNPYASDRPEEQHNASAQEGGGQWHHAGSLEDVADEGSVWETAKKWAYSAGEKMAETEAGIWKRVNGEK